MKFDAQLERKTTRKLKARRDNHTSVYFGLGLFGIVGWSVAVPTLLAIALGVWIDRRWPGPYSWTLMLLVVGVVLGCINAWRWVQKSQQEQEQEQNAKRGD